MPWRRVKRLGIRQWLLMLLVPVMIAISAIELYETYRYSAEAANAAYDRSLLGVIKTIDANVSTSTGGLSVELPYRLFELFELTASGSVHFRVATIDGLVEIGSPDVPKPPEQLTPGKPVFYDAQYYGEIVRVGAYLRELDRRLSATGAQHLVIQVAESTRSRADFTRRFLANTARRDVTFLLSMIVAVVAIVAISLRPISRLAAQIRGRAPSDLAPIEERDLPGDIQPLVDAINGQLRRSNDLVSQQRLFLDDASHQLRTPLTTLRMQVDQALRDPDPDQLRTALTEISQQIDYATRSTNQLLALARSDTAPIEITCFDLAELVRDTIVALLPNARAKHLDVGFDPPSRPVSSLGDAGLLREAIANLIENAIRYTPERGEITVVARLDAAGFVVSVVDNGPGVHADEFAALGKRFARGRGRGAQNGSGLGLAIARSIMERHLGSITLQPGRDGQGLLATLWWPRVRTIEEGTGHA